jgi:hypothetical protein
MSEKTPGPQSTPWRERASRAAYRHAPVLILFAAMFTAGLVLAWVYSGGLVRP